LDHVELTAQEALDVASIVNATSQLASLTNVVDTDTERLPSASAL
jgi:hypothetical protein